MLMVSCTACELKSASMRVGASSIAGPKGIAHFENLELNVPVPAAGCGTIFYGMCVSLQWSYVSVLVLRLCRLQSALKHGTDVHMIELVFLVSAIAAFSCCTKMYGLPSNTLCCTPSYASLPSIVVCYAWKSCSTGNWWSQLGAGCLLR